MSREGRHEPEALRFVVPRTASRSRLRRQPCAGRLGSGWDEWTRDRFTALGRQGYIDERLNPASIDEATNTDLVTRSSTLVPPDTIQELQALDLVRAVYARRQLEQQATL